MKFRILFFLLLVMIDTGSASSPESPPGRPALILLWDWPLNEVMEDISFNFLMKTNLSEPKWKKFKTVSAWDCLGEYASVETREVTKVVIEEDGTETYSVEWVLYINGLSASLPTGSDKAFFVMSYSKEGVESDIF